MVDPDFSSRLTDVVMELEQLRQLELSGDTPAAMFFQLKDILHTLGSLGTARFGVDHATLLDCLAGNDDNSTAASETVREIRHVERAMGYVDEVLHAGGEITERLICELHRISMDGLSHEGDKTPGQYRDGEVRIVESLHLPPDPVRIAGFMQELVEFINRADAPKYDLLKMALANHRFCWIHPFNNGNGRVVRLLSYAMMIRSGFNVQAGGRALNPTAVFCTDRVTSYAKLSAADTGSDAGLQAWCLHVLNGVRDELKKLECLTRYDYLRDEILEPALAYCKELELMTDHEEALLAMAISQRKLMASDLDGVLADMTPYQRSHQLAHLLAIHWIRPVAEAADTYTINFTRSPLLRGVIHALEQKGFVPPLAKAART